jgi:hypothetical protein
MLYRKTRPYYSAYTYFKPLRISFRITINPYFYDYSTWSTDGYDSYCYHALNLPLRVLSSRNITAASYAKSLGIKNLKVVSRITGQSTQTLNNWFNTKRKLFDIVLKGCISELD